MSGLRQRLGARGEELAERVLLDAGMAIVDRNWRCREGEIDLIAVDEVGGKSTVVFCEVKLRRGRGFGSPLEAVTFEKVRRLRRAAAAWLREHPVAGMEIRIDVIGLLAIPDQPIQVTHVRGVE
jgi:putative endonuclease